MWMCGKGHVLGLVKVNGRGIHQLLLYRNATPTLALGTALPSPVNGGGEDGEVEVEVMAVVEGLVMDVRCSVCGEIRTWAPDWKAVKKMMRRYEKGGG